MRRSALGSAGALALVLSFGQLHAQRVQLLTPMDSLVRRAERDSNDAPAHYEAALGYWIHKKYDEAEHHLRLAITIEPRTASAYLALAFLPYARRPKLWDEVEDGKVPAEWAPKVEESASLYRKAFLIDPMVDLRPLALMLPTAGSLGLDGSRSARAFYTYLMNGLGSFWVGDYPKAYAFFQEVVKGVSEEEHQKYSDWFLWYEALASLHAGDHARAITNVRTLLGRAERSVERSGGATLAFSDANHYRYALACILAQGGQTREAVTMLQEALTNDVGLYAAHVRLAEIYEGQRRGTTALTERRRAVAANPEDPSLLADLGEAEARAGQLPEAHATLRLAVQANPRSHRALYLLGKLARQAGNSDEAKSAWTRFLALAPSRWETQRQEVQQQLAALN